MNEEQREALLNWIEKVQWSAVILVHRSIKRICPLCRQSEDIGHAWNCETKALIDSLMKR